MTEVKWISIVDDDAGVREALQRWLPPGGYYRLKSEHCCAEDAVATLPEFQPDVLILDIRMGAMDGLECLECLRDSLPITRIIMFTAFGDEDVLHHALAGRANGLVTKGPSWEPLFDAIVNATCAGFYLPDAGFLSPRLPTVGAPARGPQLARREREMVELLATGLGQKEIAARLGIEPQSVANRLAALYRRLGVHTAAGAVARALKLGLIKHPGESR